MGDNPVARCPECGHALLEEPAYCPECGFRFTPHGKGVPLPAGILLITFLQITGSFIFLLYSDLSGSVPLIMVNVLLIALGVLFFMRFSFARWIMVIVFPVLLFFMVRDSLLILPRGGSAVQTADIVSAILAIIAFVYLLTPGVGRYFGNAPEKKVAEERPAE